MHVSICCREHQWLLQGLAAMQKEGRLCSCLLSEVDSGPLLLVLTLLLHPSWLILQDRLLVVHSVSPEQRVYELQPNGTALLRHVTRTGACFAVVSAAVLC